MVKDLSQQEQYGHRTGPASLDKLILSVLHDVCKSVICVPERWSFAEEAGSKCSWCICRGEVEDWSSVCVVEDKAPVGVVFPCSAKQQWLV